MGAFWGGWCSGWMRSRSGGFLPVLAGMYGFDSAQCLTSRSNWGIAPAGRIVPVPEEVAPPPEIVSLRLRMDEMEQAGETRRRPMHNGLADAVLNPYVNAVHVSLLRERRLNPAYQESLAQSAVGTEVVRALGKTARRRAGCLTAQQKLLVLSDADTMSWLHRWAWLRPSETFAPWWQQAIRKSGR